MRIKQTSSVRRLAPKVAGGKVSTISLFHSYSHTDGLLEPWGQLIAKFAEAGIPSLIAAGNDGRAGMFLSSDGLHNPAAFGVGAFNNLYTPMLLAKGTYSANGTTKELGWEISGKSDFVNGTYQLYPLSISSSIISDGCKTLPANTPDLPDKIVLIRRGGYGFQAKQDNVAKAGARC